MSVGNASSKRFQMETYIESITRSVWTSNPYTSISPTFFLKDKGVRSQKGIWTPLCNDVLHTYLDLSFCKCKMYHVYMFLQGD